MADKIRAIETQYAGCRFRSRLEARWAVFFDHLGIEWAYEPEGIEVADGTRYLPDFWIPDWQLHVEVKAEMSHVDFLKTLRVMPLRKPADNQFRNQLLILGPIPRPGFAWTHGRLDVLGGCMDSVFIADAYFSHFPVTYPHQVGHLCRLDVSAWLAGLPEQTQFFRKVLVEAQHHPRLTVDPTVDAAYQAARSARFEFGESG